MLPLLLKFLQPTMLICFQGPKKCQQENKEGNPLSELVLKECERLVMRVGLVEFKFHMSALWPPICRGTEMLVIIHGGLQGDM